MDTMDCGQARNLLSDHQDGTLDAATAAALAAHLRGCGDCAECAGALLAVRKLLRNVPPDPAPPELFARVLAAVEAEGRGDRADAASEAADAPRPFLSRFRTPIEAAAVLLLFASVYWYQRPQAPAGRQASDLASGIQSESGKRSASGPAAAKGGAVVVARSTPVHPSGDAKPAGTQPPAAAKPRAWTTADLPSVPAIRASSDSERIVPLVPGPGPGTGTGGDAAGTAVVRGPETERTAEASPSRVFAAPPSRLLRLPPYGRDIVVDVDPRNREGVEERIADAATRLGGFVERIDRVPEGGDPGDAGTVRVILPGTAANRFLEEVGRIGTIPPEGKPAATDLPAGPRPGSVAYAVRIRVR